MGTTCPLWALSVARFSSTQRHTRPRKRLDPSTPFSDQSRSFWGGAANRMKSLTVSAPNRFTISVGSTTLPRDFDILAPSLMTMPCVSRLVKGSRTRIRPMSARNFVKNRA